MNRKHITCVLVFSLLLNACTGSGKGGLISDLSSSVVALTGVSNHSFKSDISKKAYRTRVGMQDDTRFQRLSFMEAAIIVAARHRANVSAGAMYSPSSVEDQQRLAQSLRQQALEYAQERTSIFQRFHSGPGDFSSKDSIELMGAGVGMVPYVGGAANFAVTFAGFMENKAWQDQNSASSALNQYESAKAYLSERALGIADGYLTAYSTAKDSSKQGVKSGELLFLEGWNKELHLAMPDEEDSIDKNLDATFQAVDKSSYSPNADANEKIKKNVKDVVAKVKNADASLGSEDDFFRSMESSYSFEVSQELEAIQKGFAESNGLTRAQAQQLFEANITTFERTGSILSSLAILMGDPAAAQRIAGFTNAISNMAKAINEMKNIEAAMKAGEMTDKVASSAKMAASAGMANAVLGMAVFLYSMQDDSASQQAKLWNEVFKQLKLIIDNLFEMRNEINEGFKRIERSQVKTMEMIDDLMMIVRFNTDVLLGLKGEVSDVHDRLREQGVLLNRISAQVDLTLKLVKLGNERSIFINSIDRVNEQCLLNSSPISKKIIAGCFDSVYTILRNAVTAVDDKPTLAASSKGRYDQFTGFFEDSVRALPLALNGQAGANISYVNQAYHLTISLLRKFPHQVVDEKYSSLRSVLKGQFEYLQTFRSWLQKSSEIEKALDVYDASRKQLSSSASSLWRATFLEVLQGSQRADAETTGNYDEPYVDVTSLPICSPQDEKGNVISGAENDDYNRDLRPLGVLDSKVWASELPDDLKKAIFYKKGTLHACTFTVISNSVAEAFASYGSRAGTPYEMFGTDAVTCTQTYKTQVRFFWQDQNSQERHQILSIDLDNIAKYSFTAGKSTAAYYLWNLAFWTVPQNQLSRVEVASRQEGRETVRQQNITDKHSRVCSQTVHSQPDGKNHNFRFMQDIVFDKKARLNEALRDYFVKNASNIKPSFVKGYAESQLNDLVEKANKQFAQRYLLKQGQFAQLEDMVYDLGYRKEVLRTMLAFSYAKTYSSNRKLVEYFSESLISTNSLPGLVTFDLMMNESMADKKKQSKAADEAPFVYSDPEVKNEGSKTTYDFHYAEGVPYSPILLSKGPCVIDVSREDNSMEAFDPNRAFTAGKYSFKPDAYGVQVPRIMGKYCEGATIQYDKYVLADEKNEPLPTIRSPKKSLTSFEIRLAEMALESELSLPSQFNAIGSAVPTNLKKLIAARKEKWIERENRNNTAAYMIELLDFEFKQNQKYRSAK